MTKDLPKGIDYSHELSDAELMKILSLDFKKLMLKIKRRKEQQKNDKTKEAIARFGKCKNCKKRKAIMIFHTFSFCSNSCRNEFLKDYIPQPENKLIDCASKVGYHLAGDSVKNVVRRLRKDEK